MWRATQAGDEQLREPLLPHLHFPSLLRGPTVFGKIPDASVDRVFFLDHEVEHVLLLVLLGDQLLSAFQCHLEQNHADACQARPYLAVNLRASPPSIYEGRRVQDLLTFAGLLYSGVRRLVFWHDALPGLFVSIRANNTEG